MQNVEQSPKSKLRRTRRDSIIVPQNIHPYRPDHPNSWKRRKQTKAYCKDRVNLVCHPRDLLINLINRKSLCNSIFISYLEKTVRVRTSSPQTFRFPSFTHCTPFSCRRILSSKDHCHSVTFVGITHAMQYWCSKLSEMRIIFLFLILLACYVAFFISCMKLNNKTKTKKILLLFRAPRYKHICRHYFLTLGE